MKKIVFTFLVVLILLVNTILSVSASATDTDKSKTIIVSIDEQYHDREHFTTEDFPEVELDALYLISDYCVPQENMCLVEYLLVLKDNVSEADIQNLTDNNQYVASVHTGYTEPFENILKLNVSDNQKIIMQVGDSIELKVEEAVVYSSAFAFDVILVRPTDYDSSRNYEPKDFPQVSLSKVENPGNGELRLYLQEPGFWNVIKAVDTIFAGVECDAVSLMFVAYPEVAPYTIWSVSDSSVIVMGDGLNDVEAYCGDNVTITALKKGSATIDVSYHAVGQTFNKTYEIEVIANETTSNIEPTVSPSKDVKVDTGESNNVIWIWIIVGLAGVLLITILMVKKNKNIN